MTPPSTTRKRPKGSALIAVLAFSFILLLSTTSLIAFGVHRRTESARLTLYNAELSTAESALAALVSQFNFMGAANPPQVTQSGKGIENFLYAEDGLMQALSESEDKLMSGYPGYVVSAAVEPLEIEGIDEDNDSVEITDDIIDLIGENDLRQWMGFSINLNAYRIMAGARATDASGMALAEQLRRPGVYVAQTVTFYRVPLLNYAIFYQNTLELDAGQQIDVYGKVHTNSDWYLTTSSTANYHSSATVAGNFYGGVYHPGDTRRGKSNSTNINVATKPPATPGAPNNANLRGLLNTTDIKINDGYLSSANYNNNFMDNRAWTDNPLWVDDANRFYKGMIRDASHGVQQVRLPINEQESPRMILEPPVVGSDPATDDRRDTSRLTNQLAYQASIILETKPGWNNKANFTTANLPNLNNYIQAYRQYPVFASDGVSVEWVKEGPFSVVYEVGKDSAGNPIPATFLNYNRIYDGRERRYVNMLDIDMGKLSQYLVRPVINAPGTDPSRAQGRFTLEKPGAAADGTSNNIAATDPGIIYVNPVQSHVPPTETAAARIVNAKDLRSVVANSNAVDMQGLTIATDGPLYTKGDVNAPADGAKLPLLFASDSIHILSNNFNDATYGAAGLTGGGPNAAAKPTTTNAIFIAGNVPTIHRYIYNEQTKEWEQNPEWTSSLGYSGGAENFFRYLENWGGSNTHTFRGSILNLFESRVHKGRWGVGGYYSPPRRNWGWDTAYASGQTPPGMPRSWNVSVSNWELISAGEFIDAGGADLTLGAKGESLENEGE